MNRGAGQHAFDLEAFIPYRLDQAAQAVSRRFARIYEARHGMTRPEWRVLANLGQNGTMTAREICRRADMHKTEISRAVARLEERRWLSRRTNPEDRREALLDLTEAGRKVFAELAGEALASDRTLVRMLGVENANALKKGLGALQTALAREHRT